MTKKLPSDYIQRFHGVARLYGEAALEKIAKSHILIIGVGGVGSWTAESLCRSGVGKITLIDMDEVCVTNTNRQLHALKDTIGQTKVSVLRNRLLQINPECQLDIREDFVTEENLELYLDHDYDTVIDAIDGLKNKTLIENYCKDKNISLVAVGGAGGKKDPTLVRSGDLSESIRDNLLKRLKKKLRVDFNFPRTGKMGIQAIYSIENAMYPDNKGGICYKKDLTDKGQTKLDCATGMGTASFATGTFGFVAAKVAIDLILK